MKCDRDRFDLEQLILKAWQVKDDIDLLLKRQMDAPEPLSEDEFANAMIGISTLHDMRMNELWDCFEFLVHERKIT
jgi:hypothetical protein